VLVRRNVSLALAALLTGAAGHAQAQTPGIDPALKANPTAPAPGSTVAQPPPAAEQPGGSVATSPTPPPTGGPAPTPVPTQGVAAAPPQVETDSEHPTGPLSLDGAVQIALSRNHDVILAALNAMQAEQAYFISRGNILPNLAFNAQVGFNYAGSTPARNTVIGGVQVQLPAEASSTSGNYGVGLSFSQLVFDGGAWWNNLDAAKFNFKSLEATVAEQKLQTTYQVTQAFLELVRAQKQLAVFEEAAKRSRDQVDFEERLYNGGKAAQADVYAARSNRDNDEINRLSSAALVDQNRYALGILLGIDPASPMVVVEPAELKDLPPAPPPPANAVERALSTRPSLVAYELALRSTQKTSSALKGRYYPSVSLQASYTRYTQQGEPGGRGLLQLEPVQRARRPGECAPLAAARGVERERSRPGQAAGGERRADGHLQPGGRAAAGEGGGPVRGHRARRPAAGEGAPGGRRGHRARRARRGAQADAGAARPRQRAGRRPRAAGGAPPRDGQRSVGGGDDAGGAVGKIFSPGAKHRRPAHVSFATSGRPSAAARRS